MRLAFLVCTVSLFAILLGCGNQNQQTPANLNGNWDTTLAKASGATAFSFSSSLRETGNTVLIGSNVAFNPPSSCFESQLAETGVVQFAGGGYGYYAGGGGTAVSLTVKGVAADGGNDTLRLQGTVNPDNSVSGTWTLTGLSVNCSGFGAFTMTRIG